MIPGNRSASFCPDSGHEEADFFNADLLAGHWDHTRFICRRNIIRGNREPLPHCGTLCFPQIQSGQDCSGYESVFQIPRRRRVCDGLNDESGSPIELHSIAHMLNLMANQGYSLDRIMGEHEATPPQNPWESLYLFKRTSY